MKKIFLFLILLHFHLTQFPKAKIIPKLNENILNNIWKLEFNNGEEIKLKRGVWKKITLELTTTQNSIFKDDKDFYGIYHLSIKDENIISNIPVLSINPNETLSYSFYIGLKCQSYPKDNYEVVFTTFYFPNGDMTSCKQLNDIIKLNLKIDNDYTKIELEPLMEEMPGNSINFFKLKKEIYNIDEITILSTNQNKEKFNVNDIIIKTFFEREELSEDNPINHGILFDYPFGTQHSFESKKEFKFKMYINNKSENMCFKLDDHEYEIDITKEGPVNLDENVKKAILYNTEDKTSRYEVTNSIKIKTKIEVFPSILTCQFIPSYLNQDSVGKNNIKLFKTFITEKDDYDIIVNDLETNTEYFANCELTSTHYEKNKRQTIIINIGNNEKADKAFNLFPSYDKNRVPHCVKFTFKSNLSNIPLWIFNILGLAKCNYHMKKEENFISKASILCQTTELTSKSAVFCAAPLPLYNLGKNLSDKEKDRFSRNFDDFINDIKKNSDNNLEETVKIIDVDISQESIEVSLLNTTFSSNILYINFTVKSTHKQPVECIYNDYLSDNYQFCLLNSSINLSENKKETINAKISNPIENKMYSLKMKCYNDLYNFKLRYKTTGIMNKYIFNYKLEKDSKGHEQDIQEEEKKNTKTIINCNVKQNLENPRCLEEKKVPIIEKLSTDLPPFLKEIENEVQLFSIMQPNQQDQYLENIKEKIEPSPIKVNENKTSLLEKVIEFTKFLTYKDCSIYASGSSNKEEDTIKSLNYIKCRQIKQHYLEQIYKFLIKYFNNLECPYINKIIISELSEDIETNLKYVLILIDELSNNPESYKKGLSSFLLNITFCLQENFDKYLEEIQKNLTELNSTISAIKKDLIYIMLQTLTNLPKVIHFDEIDGYINKEKTKTGLILSEDNIKIQKKIIDFSQKLNNFGDELYELSGSMFSKIKHYKGLNSSFDVVVDTINIPNKNMILRIYSNYMLRKNNAQTLQILVFDSPIVSIKASKDTEKYSDSVNTFISIILYDKYGKEIPIKNIDEKYRPEILYLQNDYNSLKSCFYYNEANKELEGDGVSIDENYNYNGKAYIKCVSSHLTAFTAGTYKFNSNIPGYVVLLIVSGILLGILTMVLIIVIAKKKNKKKRIRISYDKINSEFHDKDELLEE